MDEEKYYKTLDECLLLLLKRAEISPVTIGEILSILSGKGKTLILIFLSLPFCQPIQIPGFSLPFGLVIALVGIKMAFGKRIWLPKKLLSKQIASSTVKKMSERALWAVKKISRWIHPRLDWVVQYPAMIVANGLIISLLGIFLALPLPIPFSNLVAAWAIFLIGLGILKDDGLLILLGYLMTLLSFFLLVWIVFQVRWFLGKVSPFSNG